MRKYRKELFIALMLILLLALVFVRYPVAQWVLVIITVFLIITILSEEVAKLTGDFLGKLSKLVFRIRKRDQS